MPECLAQFLGGVCVGIGMTGIVLAIAQRRAIAHFRAHGYRPDGKPLDLSSPPRGGSGVSRKAKGEA